MTICTHCGVELDNGLNSCPLCGRNPQDSGEKPETVMVNPSEILQQHKKENRKHLWELSGVIAFSGIAVCTLVDLLINRIPGWSIFSDVVILALWIILTLFLYAYRRIWVIIPALLATVLTALFLLDRITGGTNWFLPVGLPLTAAAFTLAGMIGLLYRFAHLKGLNIIAAGLLLSAGFCILTEIVLDNFLNGFLHLRWSLIVAVSVLPVTLIFIFYQYRLKKGNRLDSLFHI